MEQDNINSGEIRQDEQKVSQSQDSPQVNIKNSEPAKDKNFTSEISKINEEIESISSDDLGTNVDENILKNIGINSRNHSSSNLSALNIQNQMAQDLENVDKLVQYGMLDSKMGRILKKNIFQKAFDNVIQSEKSKSIQQEKNNVFEEFNKNSNDFFQYDGRRDVLNYLQNEVSGIGMKDLSKISEMIEIVEKSAIRRYLKKISHEKSLKSANEQAKQKLTANAQQSSDGAAISQTFTRAQIGKMSRKEFEKYEKAIMKQLREGKFK